LKYFENKLKCFDLNRFCRIIKRSLFRFQESSYSLRDSYRDMSQYSQESAVIDTDDGEQRKRIRTERIRKQEAERKRKQRASESPGSHQARLQDQRSRTATLRASETPNTSQGRREADQERHAIQRASETPNTT